MSWLWNGSASGEWSSDCLNIFWEVYAFHTHPPLAYWNILWCHLIFICCFHPGLGFNHLEVSNLLTEFDLDSRSLCHSLPNLPWAGHADKKQSFERHKAYHIYFSHCLKYFWQNRAVWKGESPLLWVNYEGDWVADKWQLLLHEWPLYCWALLAHQLFPWL